eukprot:11444053-Prorocentrum_lima.AAC.1
MPSQSRPAASQNASDIMAGWKALQTQNPARNAHYPRWPLQDDDSVYDTATRLSGGDSEGHLVDIGAYHDLM